MTWWMQAKGVHPLGGQSVDAVEQFPGPLDRLLLEVIAVGPVAQHLEHGVVVGVVPHLFQIVVLAMVLRVYICKGSEKKLKNQHRVSVSAEIRLQKNRYKM